MGMGRLRNGYAGLLGVMLLWGCHEPEHVRRVQAIAALDQQSLDFGEVPVGEWSEREVRIRNVGGAPFNALEALGLEKNPSFQVELTQGRVHAGEEHVVTLRFQTAHGAQFWSHKPFNWRTSRSVSMHCQKPSCR